MRNEGFLHDLAYDDKIPAVDGEKIKSFFKEELPGLNDEQLAEVFGAISYYMMNGVVTFKGHDQIQFVLGTVAKTFAKLYTDYQADASIRKLLAEFKGGD